MTLQATRAHYEQQARDAQGRFAAPDRFAEFNRYCADPVYRAEQDAGRETNRRAAYADWSRAFDAGHPLGPDHERHLMEMANLSRDEITAVSNMGEK